MGFTDMGCTPHPVRKSVIFPIRDAQIWVLPVTLEKHMWCFCLYIYIWLYINWIYSIFHCIRIHTYKICLPSLHVYIYIHPSHCVPIYFPSRRVAPKAQCFGVLVPLSAQSPEEKIRISHTISHKINGNFRILNWRYLPYIRPMFQAYVRGYTPKYWPYMVQYLHFRILEFPLIKHP